MSKKNDNFVNSKFSILEKYWESLPRVDRGCHKLVCGIFDKRGRVISFGNNTHWKTHPQAPKIKKWKTEIGGEYQCLHAEIHAIIQAEKTNWNPKKSFLFIFRKGKDGNKKMSKPCSHCQAAISYKEIGNVYYLNNEGLVENYGT